MKTVLANPTKRFGVLIAGMLSVSLFALSCTIDPGGGTESSGVGVRLTGRVVGSGNMPIAGVVVTAARAGLSDTTDAFGRYVLSRDTAEDVSGAGVLDTLRYVKNGQSLARVSVLHWIDSLPDIQVIQRDISGTLSIGELPVSKIEAVLTGDGIDSLNPVVTEFYYNALARNYSGYKYFPPASSTLNYQVVVNVYGPEGVLFGRSLTVPFNSFAGNITVPSFSANNAFPVANAGSNRTIPVGSTVALNGTATDAFGGSIVKWEWKIGDGPYLQTASGDTTIVAPLVRTAAYICILRVTDNEGNASEKAITLKVTNDNPVLVPPRDTVAVIGEAITVTASASDSQGVVRYIWDFNNDGIPDDTTAIGSITITLPPTPGTSRIRVTAQDAYDGIATDTFKVIRLSTGVNWVTRASGTTKRLTNVHWTGSQFIAVGDSNTILTSPDGVTWTPRVTLSNGARYQSVASQGSQIVVLGSPRTGTTPDSSVIISNDGGATWSYHNGQTFQARQVTVLKWLGGQYIGTANPAGILISQDGINWQLSITGGTNALSNLIWTGSQYMNTRLNSPPRTSPDGVTWTNVTGEAPYLITSMVWADDRVVTLGDNSYHSFDGSTWTQVSNVIRDEMVRSTSAVWTGDNVVGVGDGGLIEISPDKGANWVSRIFGTSTFRSVAWNGTRLVAVGDNGTIITSP
jgi:hypothetical protein